LYDPGMLEYALEQQAPNRLCYEHFDFEVHGPALSAERWKGLKIVALFRHPLDALISHFYRMGWRRTLFYPDKGAMENLRLYIRGRTAGGDIAPEWGPMGRWDWAFEKYPLFLRRYASEWARSGRALPVRYEDLVADTTGQLSRVLDHLKIRHRRADLPRICHKHRFEVYSQGRPRGVEDVNAHYRKGSPGEWREVFTAEELRILHAAIGPEMDILGYPAAELLEQACAPALPAAR
jgi:hypothetical protein